VSSTVTTVVMARRAAREQHPHLFAGAMLIAAAVLLAAASNNLVKGIYSYSLGDRKTGIQSLALLAVLAAVGLARLVWL
jgi:uncharacterized membrane protein (DUF4010 family)